jgi:hypothetical protein
VHKIYRSLRAFSLKRRRKRKDKPREQPQLPVLRRQRLRPEPGQDPQVLKARSPQPHHHHQRQQLAVVARRQQPVVVPAVPAAALAPRVAPQKSPAADSHNPGAAEWPAT